MLILVIVCLSSYYRFVLLPHYELMPPRTSVAYVQIISSDIARASHITLRQRMTKLDMSEVCKEIFEGLMYHQ
jgi:hypothetical protein